VRVTSNASTNRVDLKEVRVHWSKPLLCSLTRCLHFIAGCTTGWVNYANERSQAALERSSQDACDVIRLTSAGTTPRGPWRRAAVWTVDDVARLMEFFKNNFY